MRSRRASFFYGKACVRCGTSEDLELDHIDRTTKVSNNVWSWASARREAELAKCQVLCHDCHKKKSAKEMSQLFTGRLNFRNRKLSDNQVRAIMACLDAGISTRKIAAALNIDRNVVLGIQNGRRYIDVIAKFRSVAQVEERRAWDAEGGDATAPTPTILVQ